MMPVDFCAADADNIRRRTTMAKPIKETPILYGKDSDKFLKRITSGQFLFTIK